MKNKYLTKDMLRGRLTTFNNYLKIIRKEKATFISFIIVVFFILMATIGRVIRPLDLSPDLSKILSPPSLEHPAGTDYGGRDVLAMLIFGSTEVLIIAFLAALFGVFIAIIVGLTSGYIGGAVDHILMFAANILLTIPSFPLLMLISISFYKYMNMFTTPLILSLTAWAGLSRGVRSQVVSVKERDFIEAAKVLGLSKTHIILREIVPTMMPYIVVRFVFRVTSAIYAQVGLQLVGALPLSITSWGMMMTMAQYSGALYSPRAIFYLLTPMLCIVVLQVALIFFAKGLDKILNPRLSED